MQFCWWSGRHVKYNRDVDFFPCAGLPAPAAECHHSRVVEGVIASGSENGHVCRRAGGGIYRDTEKAASLMIALAIGVRVFCTDRFNTIGEIPGWPMIAIFSGGVPNAFNINSCVLVCRASALREQQHRGRDHGEGESQNAGELLCHLTRTR